LRWVAFFSTCHCSIEMALSLTCGVGAMQPGAGNAMKNSLALDADKRSYIWTLFLIHFGHGSKLLPWSAEELMLWRIHGDRSQQVRQCCMFLMCAQVWVTIFCYGGMRNNHLASLDLNYLLDFTTLICRSSGTKIPVHFWP
jgi:hypothetical protein